MNNDFLYCVPKECINDFTAVSSMFVCGKLLPAYMCIYFVCMLRECL